MASKLCLSGVKDLINLSFFCQEATVITDFSDLERVGKATAWSSTVALSPALKSLVDEIVTELEKGPRIAAACERHIALDDGRTGDEDISLSGAALPLEHQIQYDENYTVQSIGREGRHVQGKWKGIRAGAKPP